MNHEFEICTLIVRSRFALVFSVFGKVDLKQEQIVSFGSVMFDQIALFGFLGNVFKVYIVMSILTFEVKLSNCLHFG